MISIEGTLSINLLKPNKAAVHQQLLKRLFFSTLHMALSQTNWAGQYTADYELQSGEGEVLPYMGFTIGYKIANKLIRHTNKITQR